MNSNKDCWNCAFSGQAKDSGVCERCCHTDKSSAVDNWTKIEDDRWCHYCKYKDISVFDSPCDGCVTRFRNSESPSKWESDCTLQNVGVVELVDTSASSTDVEA